VPDVITADVAVTTTVVEFVVKDVLVTVAAYDV